MVLFTPMGFIFTLMVVGVIWLYYYEKKNKK